MRFLFVSNYYDDVPCGGRNLARAHWQALNQVCGNEGTLLSTLSEHHTRHDEPGKISVVCARNKLQKLMNPIRGRIQGFSFVCFDDKICGSAVKALKQKAPGLKIYTFYHSVHYEELAARYSDVNIVLNEAERKKFEKTYSRECRVMPICLADTANLPQCQQGHSHNFRILFVGGGKHIPNVEGVRWFAQEVMPLVDKRAEFCVVGPIFSGGGMMTKTAEALMWGTNYLATGHALTGYEGVEESRCDTAQEFADKINAMIATRPAKYNPKMLEEVKDNA